MGYSDRLKGVKESFPQQAVSVGIVGLGGLVAVVIALYGLSKIDFFNKHWWATPGALLFGGAVTRNLSAGIGDGMVAAGVASGFIAWEAQRGTSATANGPLNAGRAMNAGYMNAGGRFAARMGGRPPIASVAAVRSAMSQTTQGTVYANQQQVQGAGAAVYATMQHANGFRARR